MPHLRCTQKLLNTLGIQKALIQSEGQSVILGDWYANLLIISRQTALLFTNEPTLYSFAVLGVKKAALPTITTLFVESLKLNLAHEDIPAYVVDRLVADYRNLSLAGTANRSVLGSMNDLANLLEHYVRDTEMASDVRQINRELNRTPHKPLGWKSAIDVLHERLLGAFAVPGRPRSRVFVN